MSRVLLLGANCSTGRTWAHNSKLLIPQGKKFPVDVFGVAPLDADAPRAADPKAAAVPADLSFGQPASLQEDASSLAAELDEAASLASSLHLLPQQKPMIGRQVCGGTTSNPAWSNSRNHDVQARASRNVQYESCCLGKICCEGRTHSYAEHACVICRMSSRRCTAGCRHC